MLINDINPHPPSATPPVTPPAGQTFKDPEFGTTILRVTDENDSAGVMFANGYSAIYDMFNCDSTRITYQGLNGSPWVAQLDVKNKTVFNKQQIGRAVTYWSRLNPNIGYSVEGWNAAKIWKGDFSVNPVQWTLLVDIAVLNPAAILPATANTTWMGSRGMSWDDNRFHCGLGTGNCVYDVKLNQLIGPFTRAQAVASGWTPDPASLDYLLGKSTMDQSGNVFWTADCQLIYNVATGATFLTKFGSNPGLQYGDVHADCGFNNVLFTCGGFPTGDPTIGQDGFYPETSTIDPNNVSTYLSNRRKVGPRIMWGLDSHTSYRDKTGQWVTFTFDGALLGADLGKTPIFGPEIVQWNLNSPPDGSINRRIAHHYSDPSVFTDPGTQYWASPHASQAQDNTVVGYNSTYGNKRIDIYIAFLDAPVQPPPSLNIFSGSGDKTYCVVTLGPQTGKPSVSITTRRAGVTLSGYNTKTSGSFSCGDVAYTFTVAGPALQYLGTCLGKTIVQGTYTFAQSA